MIYLERLNGKKNGCRGKSSKWNIMNRPRASLIHASRKCEHMDISQTINKFLADVNDEANNILEEYHDDKAVCRIVDILQATMAAVGFLAQMTEERIQKMPRSQTFGIITKEGFTSIYKGKDDVNGCDFSGRQDNPPASDSKEVKVEIPSELYNNVRDA